MIKEAFAFLAEEVNKYLSLKLGVTTDPRLIVGNVVKVYDTDGQGGNNNLTNKAILSLINIEEDRISKSQENFSRSDDRVVYKNPKIHLNLYALYAVNRTDYSDALKWLSLIIQHFQYQNVFTPRTNPSLDSRIDTLILDLYSVNMEQLNHLWGVLGGKYIPSALYKVRVVGIEEDMIDGSGPYIKEIGIMEKSL
jgi:hypothetical protein